MSKTAVENALPIERDVYLSPASFAQQRMWFLDQFEGGGAAYHLPVCARLEGKLDVAALSATLDEIVRRHDTLRTTFEMHGQELMQVVADEGAIALESVALFDMPEAGRRSALLDLIAEEARRPFSLQHGPLVRARLLCLGETEHVVVLTLHHIISDGWSIGVLMSEIGALYSAYAQDLPSPLPELPIQYADYADWQADWLSGDTLTRQVNYWRALLDGAPTLLQLPTDRPRPTHQTQRGAALPFVLTVDTTAALSELSRQGRCTLFMTLTAAFNVLLSRYAGQDDICIGTPVANRRRVETEGLIGLFVNTLVLRTEVDHGASFLQLLDRVRGTTLDAYAHQDLPFERLVEALRPERHTSHSVLFQVMLILQNTPSNTIALPGLTMQGMAVERVSSKFDLTLNLSETALGLRGAFEYNTDLFDASTIERMAGHFTRLLEAIVADPQRRIQDLDMLDDAERRQLLVEWNDTARDYGVASMMPALFEERAAASPDRVALVHEGEQLTYGELNVRANRLAHHLRTLGVGPDVLVGLCVERSLEMMVGLLAILKAGGAYVPLDPAYPADRLAYMLEDAAPVVLLTQQRLLASVPTGGVPVFCLDADAASLAGYEASNPSVLTTGGNLAYVIYTSGSTGKPKGVALNRANLANFLHSMGEAPGMNSDDVLVAVTSLSFDIAALELFLPLANGARVVLAGRETASNPQQLSELLVRSGATMMQATPSSWRMLVDHGWPQELQLKVLCGGEALPVGLMRDVLGHVDAIWNLYGPTETTIWSTLRRVSALDGAPVIGKPIANTQVYILDAGLNPVPAGVAGELHIAGEGLARGYLHRGDLTADKFIPNPFGAAGSRMYKSGDLARYLGDGSIEYLGRIDNQVKLRGFRIELGEIESALAGLATVRDALVLAREDVAGDKRLVAYLVAHDGEQLPDAAGLRAALLASLPEYMVPAHFMVLERMPLTPNGKVDRKALPAPDMARSEEGYVAPRTAAEEIMAGIWAGVLRLDKVGIHDNFFALGGHSLLATQLVSQIRGAFEIELPLRAVFEAPTIAGLLTRMESAQRGLTVTALAPVERKDGMPLSFAQQRLWFLDQFEPGSAFYNIPAAVRLSGQLDVAALQGALNEIVRRHEALRTRFASVDGTPVQVIAPESQLALEATDLSDLPHAERDAKAQWLVQDEAQTPFDLATGPLIRARLLRLSESEHIVLLTMHHIVSDGWSIGVLVQEVAALYGAYVQQQPSPLPELPIQYADFAHWQRQWLSGDVLQRQLDYWQGHLTGAPALLTLPTDHPRPVHQTHRGATQPPALSATTTAALNALSRQKQSTLFMTLTAAFNVLLSRYAGQDDISIGTPIANRNRAETEGLIGFFVNTLVLRTQVDHSASFLQLLDQVRGNTLDAYAHQDVPFEQLVDVLKPERHTSHSPLFQVMLALQNAPMDALTLPGLTLQAMGGEGVQAKFDLTFTFTEEAGRLIGSISYNTDLFEPSTMARMAAHFTRLLEAIVAAPERCIQDLDMLDDAERRQLLVEWNDTARDYRSASMMPALFEERAAASPDRVALVHEGEQLTYGELNARANRLAHHLRTLGVGPDVLVGLCVERSLEMMVGLLAILKSGGAYVPLDPAYPADRLAYMLEDAAPVVLLTQQRLLASVPTGGVPVFRLDADAASLDAYAATNPDAVALPQHLAYVIYTSGSTGKPKGVALNRANLANFLHSMGEAPGMNSDDVLAAVTSLSFDIAALELFLPLANGARVVLAGRETASNPQQLSELLVRSGATMMQATPSSWRMLVDHGWPQELQLKVLCGGEALPVGLMRDVLGHVDAIWNLYGPTETTIWSTLRRVSALDGAPVIGKPIANTQVYILDAGLNPVPAGVAGELHIAGEGLARGYLHRGDLTADKFIPNPFGAAGSRMYKSGDLARYLQDGSIEYLGRIDNQVKLRGFRIELGEIESALAGLATVRDALVLAREDVAGDKRLVAYLVAHEDAQLPDTEGLRAALLASLPEYMVPAHFMVLERMPLTPNGKVDRKALPAPDMARSEEGYVAPRTAAEEIMAGIWAGVLRLDKVGVHDNFFSLGGHSLLATQLVSQIRGAFEIELPLRAVFEAPTVAGLLARMASMQYGLRAAPLVAADRSQPLPLSFQQQRLWFVHEFMEGQKTSYNMPIALRLRGKLSTEALRAAFMRLIDRHESLRTTFDMEIAFGEPRQHVGAPSVVDIPVHAVTPEEAVVLQAQHARHVFDLRSGPLLKASLLQLGAEHHILLINLHHIISDGWSHSIMSRDLKHFYQAHLGGQPAALPAMPIQYADYAAWQRSQDLSADYAYWKSVLDGYDDALPLPYDRPRPPQRVWHAGQLRHRYPEELSRQIAVLSQAQHATLFMTLLSAFAIVLYQYTGRTDLCIGTTTAGRDRSELEGVIGFFINILPLRLDLSGDPGAAELLQRVKAVSLAAFEHQALPFEQLLEALGRPRDESRIPLVPIMLRHQNFPPAEIDGWSDELTVEPVVNGSRMAVSELDIQFFGDGAGLEVRIDYAADLFDHDTVARMMEYHQQILEMLAAGDAEPPADERASVA
ncbi:amino acid adenylation domain containing protein [Janthinobacterium sp. HH01]|uniref:non-ribosomal peptide synthetase n=1 Tax=Janthinobacterium sp. HH01 TaxID=1198452 RepID=UPI0002AE80D1|nr:non-ribosomal peptide synthetase [Janthinobacterium sp. HH01]ELX13938.1 amino acid adenylation domain containing protein [Janthinobacterium sp. HH01]